MIVSAGSYSNYDQYSFLKPIKTIEDYKMKPGFNWNIHEKDNVSNKIFSDPFSDPFSDLFFDNSRPIGLAYEVKLSNEALTRYKNDYGDFPVF